MLEGKQTSEDLEHAFIKTAYKFVHTDNWPIAYEIISCAKPVEVRVAISVLLDSLGEIKYDSSPSSLVARALEELMYDLLHLTAVCIQLREVGIDPEEIDW